MSKALSGFSLNSFISPSPSGDWYKNVNYEDAKNMIKEKMMSSAENFVAIGYYLKHIDETGQYKEGGYASIWECARQEFGFSQSKASRCINICRKYSADGDSPYINERFKNFDISQLQEMLPIRDDHLIEQITPDMSTREIRNMRNAGDTKEEADTKILKGQMQLTTVEGMQLTTVEGDYREFTPAPDVPDKESPIQEQDTVSVEPEKNEKAVQDMGEDQSEAAQLLCNDENIEEAVEFIFGSCNGVSFPQNVMDELTELFRNGKDQHYGYDEQQDIFDKELPFKNDVVEVVHECGYLVRYIHTNEWIRIPVYPFWKAFEKCHEWMWKENEEDEGIDPGTDNKDTTEHFCYDLERVKIQLPCAVGETVYFYEGGSMEEGTVDQITLVEQMKPLIRVYDADSGAWFYFEVSDFGVIVFFTKDNRENN